MAVPIQRRNFGASEHVAQLGQQRGAGEQLEASVHPRGEDLSRRSGGRDRGGDEDVCVEDGEHAPLWAFGAALAAHRVQLAVGELERFVGVQDLGGLGCLAVQRRGDAFAAARELEVTLVGEHDGLGSAASADHNRLGVGAGLPEAL